jgi:predicted aspartyl protease
MKRLLWSLLLSIILGSFCSNESKLSPINRLDGNEESFQRQRVVEIKFEIAFGGIVFFPVRVNSAGPFQFLLDTGGGGSSVDREIAKTLGLKMERGQASVSGNASLEVGVIPEATIQIADTQLNGRLLAAPLSPLEPIFGRRLDGILGGNFMMQHVVELDFEDNVMRLHDPGNFRYGGRGSELPFSIVDGIPYVELNLSLPNGKATRGSFLIDTGGNMVVHVHRQVAVDRGLLEGLATLPETGYGIGGGSTSRVASRGSVLSIGPYRFKQPIVVFTDDTAGLRANPASVGLLGMEVLRRFKVTFDYGRSRMYLEPNSRFSDPFVYDASGLRLRASRPSFSPPFVSGVSDSSPASEAGIVRGDVLLAIDGRSTLGVAVEAIRKLLRQPNKSYELTLSRGEKRLTVKLRTREML